MEQCSHHANSKHTESGCHQAATTSIEQQAEQDHNSAIGNGDPSLGSEHAWHIAGMDCPSCAGKIETALRRLPGVLSADVRFTTERLLVRLAPNTSPHQVADAIRGIGFILRNEQTSSAAKPNKPTPWWQRYHAILVLVMLLLTASVSLLVLPSVAPVLFALATLRGLWPTGYRGFTLANIHLPRADHIA